ncbi:hypothetical protein GJ496_008634 [Pomphorhynchus laevis]|nr:hypothetical protein GJ496_008634 [Pomphorhynchus laevis]
MLESALNHFYKQKKCFQQLRGVCFTCIQRALPPKPKKKIDPAVLKLREERKKKKIERGLKKISKMARVLKPIEELEADRIVLREKDKRTRSKLAELTESEQDRRFDIIRQWERLKSSQINKEIIIISKALQMQDQALDALKKLSPTLYNAALQKGINNDKSLQFPITFHGPVETLSPDNFQTIEGDYTDTTNVFEKGFNINVLERISYDRKESSKSTGSS